MVTNGRTEDELGKINPNDPGACWIVSGQETSQARSRHLEALEDDVLAKLGLERATVTVQRGSVIVRRADTGGPVSNEIGDRIGLQLTWTDWRPLNGA